jgi:hypothetical protein
MQAGRLAKANTTDPAPSMNVPSMSTPAPSPFGFLTAKWSSKVVSFNLRETFSIVPLRPSRVSTNYGTNKFISKNFCITSLEPGRSLSVG